MIRYLLGGLLAFGAINAFAGGWYGLAGAPGVPVEWLAGSPFRSYFVPSLILFAVVGGACAIGAIAVFANFRPARFLAFLAGIIVVIWICVQVAIIGYVSWMQPATLLAGIVIVGLTWLMPDAPRRR